MTEESKELAKTTDLSTWDGEIIGTMTRPSTLDPNDLTGTENIAPEEIRLPRLAIAQGLSYQMTPGDALYIEGLTLFDMFNDQTNEIYGKGPMHLVVLQRRTACMEFAPRKEGGGLLDPDVPKNDPRRRWTKSSPELAKADTPPAATDFVEFIVMLLRKGHAPEPIMFSIAQKNKWNRRAADKITSVVGLRHAPIYASVFSVDTHIPAKNDSGTFGVPTIRDLGFIPKDTPIGAALYNHVEAFAKSMQGKTIVVERTADDAIDDSMAANQEGPAAEM